MCELPADASRPPPAARLDGPECRRARGATYGIVAVLLCAAVVQLELWPVTAFRLFSAVRTGTRTFTELVAIAPDGSGRPCSGRG